MIYEERRITLKRGQIDSFIAQFKESTLPAIRSHGGETLCTLSGLIGDPPEEIIQVTAYPGRRHMDGRSGRLRHITHG